MARLTVAEIMIGVESSLLEEIKSKEEEKGKRWRGRDRRLRPFARGFLEASTSGLTLPSYHHLLRPSTTPGHIFGALVHAPEPVMSSDPTPDAGRTEGVAFQTAFLFALRGVFFLLCRHYVNSYLFSDLRAVIHEDGPNGDETPDPSDIAMEDAEQGFFPPSSGSGVRSRTDSDDSSVPGSGTGVGTPLLSPGKGLGRRESLASGRGSPGGRSDSIVGKATMARQQNVLYPKLSTSLFCLSFSESSMLFTLVLFGEAVGDRARALNWSISLLALLSLIVFIIPLGLCLLLTHRTRTTPAPRTLFLTLIPFSLYLFAFYEIGSWIASKVVVEGSHSLGLINALLSRLCVPGVALIASLSGGGAVNTAWEAFEWRSISSAEPVTESQVIAAERSLYRARLDISQRSRALLLATSSAQREAEDTAAQSIFSRWTSRAPAAAHLATLQMELTALEGMEAQMVRDTGNLKRRKELREMGRTFKGRVWLAAGWALSIYCIWRVFVSCINLIFGYSRPRHHSRPVPDDGSAPQGTDLITSLLGRLALLIKIDIDIATWSRLIGLILIGSIILANMRNVLGSVSRVFKATSTGVSASFMLLFLAQLMSVYLLTSLISLPSAPSESSNTLLDTLPSFDVFSRLFDGVFLVAAGGVFVLRWVERKIRVDDNISLQYS